MYPSQSQETCDELNTLGSGSSDVQLVCVPNDECDHVTCTPTFDDAVLDALGIQFNLTLLPCREPAIVAVELTVFAGSTLIDSYTYTEPSTVRSITIPIAGTMTVNLTQTAMGINLSVSNLIIILLHLLASFTGSLQRIDFDSCRKP